MKIIIDALCALAIALIYPFLFILAKLRILKTPIMYHYPWTYDFSLKLFYGSFYKERSEIFLKAAKINRNDSVLEIGCGSGALCSRFKMKEYVGTDISDAMFIKNLPSNARLIKADVNRLDLGRRFDKILMVDILHHVGRKGKALQRAVYHAKKDGKIYVWDAYSIKGRFESLARQILSAFDGDEGDWYSAGEFKAALSKVRGAELVRFETYPKRNVLAVLEVL
ncbi:MAG: class I SAM-dependent methyltransferase [Candidatus Micrarchaeota archaeon]